jgi:hypothetical protein
MNRPSSARRAKEVSMTTFSLFLAPGSGFGMSSAVSL